MIIAIVLTAFALGFGTWGFGWLSVPVIGLVVGLAGISKRPVWTAGLAAVFAWGDLLALGWLGGPVGELAGVLGEVMGLPAAAMYAVTVLFAAIVAGAAAGVGSAVREMRAGEST